MNHKLYPPLSIYELGQRQNQEDSIAQWDNRLFILCDGMGGHERGEVASQTVCQSLVKWFEEHINDDTLTDDQLRAALEFAYSELDKQDDGGVKKMGTTLTLLYIHNQGVTAAHIGDSSIYHIRPQGSSSLGRLKGAILYQSRDHSLVFDLYQAGEITYEEMATYPQKNIITRAMQPGLGNRMRPDIIHITNIQPGDYFYMCSDGMLEQMSNEELVDLLSSDVSDEEKQRQLIKKTAVNQDNHSAWLIHVKDVVREEGDALLVDEERTSRCNVVNIHPQLVDTFNDDVSIVKQAQPIDLVKPSSKQSTKVVPKLGIKTLIIIVALLALALFIFLGVL
jgi:protein phosphatase